MLITARVGQARKQSAHDALPRNRSSSRVRYMPRAGHYEWSLCVSNTASRSARRHLFSADAKGSTSMPVRPNGARIMICKHRWTSHKAKAPFAGRCDDAAGVSRLRHTDYGRIGFEIGQSPKRSQPRCGLTIGHLRLAVLFAFVAFGRGTWIDHRERNDCNF